MSPGTRRHGPAPTPPAEVAAALAQSVRTLRRRPKKARAKKRPRKTIAPARAQRPPTEPPAVSSELQAPVVDIATRRRRKAPSPDVRMEERMDVPDVVGAAPVPTPPPTQPPHDTTRPAEKKARRGRREPVEVVAKEPRGAMDRVTLTMMLGSTGLPLHQKSSDHWGDPRGARLVVPPAGAVTRLFVYRLPDARGLPGWVPPEERKARRLGMVTHVADVATVSEVEALIVAVCHANGLPVPSRAQLDEAAVGRRPPSPSELPRRAPRTRSKGNKGGAAGKPAAGPEGDEGGDGHGAA